MQERRTVLESFGRATVDYMLKMFSKCVQLQCLPASRTVALDATGRTFRGSARRVHVEHVGGKCSTEM